MKRIINICAVLIACFMMTGCTSVDNVKTEQPVVQQLTDYKTVFADGGDAAYLLLDGTDYGLGFTGKKLMKFDKVTKTMAVLCNDENCSHSTESCSTFFEKGITPASVGYCNGEIYVFAESNTETDRQGNSLKYLYRFDENTLERTKTNLEYAGDMYYPVFKNGNSIYYIYRHFSAEKGKQNVLVKADINTGSGQVVLAASPNYEFESVGIDGNNIVLIQSDLFSDSVDSTMFFYNVDSGNITENKDFSLRSERICAPVGPAYIYNQPENRLYTYENGKKKTVLQMNGALAGCSIMEIMCEYDDMIIALCSKNTGEATKLAINTETGQYHEIILEYKQYENDDYFTEVYVLGAVDEGFIVINGRSFYDVTAQEKPSHGQAFQKVDHLAFISAQDFFDSRREYLQLN